MSASTDHGEADVGHLEGGGVVGAVARHGHHLTTPVDPAVDDALHQDVLVLGRCARQHAQRRPYLINVLLTHLATQQRSSESTRYGGGANTLQRGHDAPQSPLAMGAALTPCSGGTTTLLRIHSLWGRR